MAFKLVTQYQARWSGKTNDGYIWFIYEDDSADHMYVKKAASFQIMVDLLRNEKPIYADSATGTISTEEEPVGEGEE